MSITGKIFDIQSFSLHDGPGTRTTVFMQGCPLRCDWCHNPESQPMRGALLYYPEKCIGCGACAEVCPSAANGASARFTDACRLCGACAEECYAEAIKLSVREYTPEALAERLLTERDVYARSGGGVTFSGGEPLSQTEFLEAVMRLMKAEGVHIAVETSLCAGWEKAAILAMYCDLIYADIKCASPDRHVRRVGAENGAILRNIRKLSAAGANMVLRTPVVPGFNADVGEIDLIGDFVSALPGGHSLELLAYHSMCAPKYAALGRAFPCEGTAEPTESEMARFTARLNDKGIKAIFRM